MKHRPQNLRIRLATLAFAVAGLWTASAAWAEDSVELKELRVALKLAQEQVEAANARAEEAETRRRAVVESLAEAVRVSEEQMHAARETELRLQALGVDLISPDESSIEQRLLKAVRDLDILSQESERRAAALRRLSETFLKVLAATPQLDAKIRSEADAALAAANASLSSSPAAASDPTDLSKARVVSVDDAIGLVVINAGQRSGLRIGTPLALLREGRPLYSALVVDVRDAISGAVLQERLAEAGEVQVGDGIRLLPEQNNF